MILTEAKRRAYPKRLVALDSHSLQLLPPLIDILSAVRSAECFVEHNAEVAGDQDRHDVMAKTPDLAGKYSREKHCNILPFDIVICLVMHPFLTR